MTPPKGFVVNLKNPEDSPQKIADKLNTLTYAIDASVIRGAVPREDFESFKDKTTKYINSNKERIDTNDQRWHGGGISRVYHDATLTGDGTINSPLSILETGLGTVTSVSVVSANGLAGTVANATTTPALTLSTTVTGLLKGNGTAISAAVANTDYQSAITLTTTGSSGVATFNGTTLNIPNYTDGNAATVTVANEATDTSCFVGFFTDATGNLQPKTNANFTYNSNTGAFGVSSINTTGNIVGGTGTTTSYWAIDNSGGAGNSTIRFREATVDKFQYQWDNGTAAMYIYDFVNSASRQIFYTTGSKATVINETGIDSDTRIEGDTDANLVFVDAGNDRVGIGISAPTEKLHVVGNILLANSSGEGWVKGWDDNHGVVFRFAGGNSNNYYSFGGTIANGLGHKFYTNGAKASQTLKLQIANDGVFVLGPLTITSANVGTSANDVPTLSSTSTLTNKTLTSPVLTTPSLGVATATSINGLTITTTTGTFTLTNAKTLAVTNTLTLSGTDSTVMTFPTTTATIARTDAGQTFTGVQVMTTPSITTANLTGAQQLAEGASIRLDQTLSADGTFSGVTIAGTAGATLAFGDLIYLAVADSRWELTDADSVTTAGAVLTGMCVLAAASDGDPTVILLQGNVRADANFPALTIGAPVYASTTPGDIQVAQPSGTDDVIHVVGFALTADSIYFNPSQDYITHT